MAALSRNLKHFISRPRSIDSPIPVFLSRGFSATIFVKGISFSSTEDTLTQAFSQCGQILDVNVIMDKKKNRPKGYAYVRFSAEEEAQKALSDMKSTLVDGRYVFLDIVDPKDVIRAQGNNKTADT